MTETADADLQLLAINTVRTLAMDAVQAAESGHPGTPMALAPLAYALYRRHVRHNPADPKWPNRDRVELSVGHASMWLYAALYLCGYDLSLEDIRQFRQWQSKTPGHPEVGHTAGVETTTGPLGQGIGNAVGMAVAEKHLSAMFNRDGHAIIDHYTWFIAGDGDLMEGLSHEAASFAGHQRLGKLIGFYDDNRITIDGGTERSCSDDAARRPLLSRGHRQTTRENSARCSGGNGNGITWVKHAIDTSVAGAHAPLWEDLDGDGLLLDGQCCGLVGDTSSQSRNRNLRLRLRKPAKRQCKKCDSRHKD